MCLQIEKDKIVLSILIWPPIIFRKLITVPEDVDKILQLNLGNIAQRATLWLLDALKDHFHIFRIESSEL